MTSATLIYFPPPTLMRFPPPPKNKDNSVRPILLIAVRAGQQLGIYFRRDNYLGDLTVKRLLYGINVPVYSLEQVLIFSNWKKRSLK